MTATLTDIPGYLAGVWDIDPIHSDVSFTARHMMVSKVRGQFRTFSGEIVTGPKFEDSSVAATIQMDSLDTNNAMRDGDIGGERFLDVANYPTMTYQSTGIRRDGQAYVVDGELTLHGVTKSVPLELELNGFGPDPYGGFRSGFTAITTINRNDFGIDTNLPMDGGGVVVSEKIQVILEIEAVLRKD
jgi:polyisoprenoid-binding protein YceI